MIILNNTFKLNILYKFIIMITDKEQQIQTNKKRIQTILINN